MTSHKLGSLFLLGMLTAGIFTLPHTTLHTKAAAEDTTNATATLKTGLENAGFTVQQGSFYELDTIKEASEGRLMSCFGNNAGSSYMVFNLPSAPDQEIPNPRFLPDGWQYKLREDEAIVLITPLPPKCKYYSFINYIMFTEQKAGKDYTNEKGFFSTGDETTGLYHPIFGSIGEPLNMQNISDDPSMDVFSGTAVIVISANQTTTESVRAQLQAAGYSDDRIHVMPIPSGTYQMGLEKGDDTFCFLGRVSQPEDAALCSDYFASLSETSTVYRVTPEDETASAPYENETLTPRGTGVHESARLDNARQHLDEIRSAILQNYQDDYDYEELRTDIAVPEGLTAYFNDTNAQGDNRDTAYLMTPDFTLQSDEDFVIVYGVNHTATGKAQYSNAVLYSRPMLNGICSVYDSLFPGSAAAFLNADSETTDQYYVYKMARSEEQPYTACIEYSTGNEKGTYYGADNNTPLFLAFRAYLDETGVGSSYYELLYDRAIIFHKKQ